jgi:hypothetical protein
MNPAKPHSGLHGTAQAGAFLRGKLAAGPAGKNDIECLEPVGICKAIQSGDRLCFPSTIDQRGAEFMDDLFRLVTIPAALNKQNLWRFHFCEITYDRFQPLPPWTFISKTCLFRSTSGTLMKIRCAPCFR